MDTSIKKICLFVTDPVDSYYKKGNIRYGAYNISGFFDEVHVISLFNSDVDADKVSTLAGKGKLFIHVVGKANYLNYKQIEKKVFPIVKSINPSLIYAFNPVIQGWMAATIGKKLNKPVIVALHYDPDEDRSSEKKYNRFKYLKSITFAKKLEKFSLQNADAIVPVYPTIIPYLERMRVKNTHLIYCGVDVKIFNKDVPRKIQSSKPIILGIGRHNDQKRYDHVIKAVKDLDVLLVLIGRGPHSEKWEKLARDLGIDEKVKFIPTVPNKDLPGYYNSADVFVQPGINISGISIPMMEAMSCGVPIVQGKEPTQYPDIFDECCIHLKDYKVESYTKAFEKILNDKDLAKKMIEIGRERVQQVSMENIAKKEYNLYKELIAKYR